MLGGGLRGPTHSHADWLAQLDQQDREAGMSAPAPAAIWAVATDGERRGIA